MGKQAVFATARFTGGWNPRATPLNLGDGGEVPMQSPDLLNCDFLYREGVAKRKGKSKQGDTIAGTAPYFDQSSGSFSRALSTNFNATCAVFVPASSKSVAIAYTSLGVAASSIGTVTAAKVVIKADSAGSPGATVTNGNSNTITDIASLSTLQLLAFTFPIPPALVAATTYWFCIELTIVGSSSFVYTTKRDAAFTTATDVKLASSNYTVFANDGAVGRLSFLLESSTPAIQGLYDYRSRDTSGAIVQNIMAANGGKLWYKAGSSWTSIQTGLANGQDYLFDFATFKNYLFSTDYAQHTNRVWDAVSTGTMAHGYRLSNLYTATGRTATIASISGAVLTMAATQAASGLYRGKLVYLTGGAVDLPEIIAIRDFTTSGTAGTATYYVVTITLETEPRSDRTAVKWNGATCTAAAAGGTVLITAPATCVRILPVTQLKSGGFRAGDEISVDVPAGATGLISLSGVAMNSSTDGTQFAFDIPTTATKWFMSPAFDPQVDPITAASGPRQTFYKIPVADLSTALNPMSNSTTAFDITDEADTTQNTLLLEYNLDQAVFTSQVDMPRLKFLETFGNFLSGAGDPQNLSRLWLMQQLSPQIASTYGQTLGSYLDINPDDGQIITGLYSWQGRLYIYKNKSAYVVTFTGNAALPFLVDRLQGNIGCLSNWSILETPKGMVFLSQQGPAICYGSYVGIIPEARDILNLFDRNDSNRFNLSAMQFSTGLNNETKFQIWWGVSSTTATIRDRVLMYDYEKGIFWPNDGISGNFFQNIGDANGFPEPWSGDYSGQVFKHDTGTNDNGAAISWTFSTPHLAFRSPNEWKNQRRMWISGEVQSSGTLYIDEYSDFASNATATYTMNMADPIFKKGLSVPLRTRSEYVRFVLRNSELDVPVRIEEMRIEAENIGKQV